MLKWTLRILLGLAATVVLAVAVTLVMFFSWRADAVAQRENDPDRRIAQTALGPIEYAVHGEGLPLLALHGTPGGYDQSLSAVRATPELAPPNTMTIAVSRPGYLGTPLSSGASFEEQADLYAALLDELGVERVVVLGASGGGGAALQFALRHPDRTMGLILYAAETKASPDFPDPRELPAMSPWRMTLLEGGMWLVGGPLRSAVVNAFDPDDPVQKTRWVAMMKTTVPWADHVPGQHNDVIQRLDPALDDWPVEQIAAPTLIMHGDADVNVDYANSVEMAERIPNAELVTFEGGDHFVMITRWEEVAAANQAFMQQFR